jgi:hypothetical protein
MPSYTPESLEDIKEALAYGEDEFPELSWSFDAETAIILAGHADAEVHIEVTTDKAYYGEDAGILCACARGDAAGTFLGNLRFLLASDI